MPKVDEWKCACVPGYVTDNCATDVNECYSDPCQYGGTCTAGVNTYNCSCARGWEGYNCELDPNECTSSPCQNGGVCNESTSVITVSQGYYLCKCRLGFTGWNCETEIDECQSSPCITADFNVTCHDMIGRYTCGDVPTLDLTLDVNISSIPAGSPKRKAFEDSFRADMARTLGLPLDRIVVTNIGKIVSSGTGRRLADTETTEYADTRGDAFMDRRAYDFE